MKVLPPATKVNFRRESAIEAIESDANRKSGNQNSVETVKLEWILHFKHSPLQEAVDVLSTTLSKTLIETI